VKRADESFEKDRVFEPEYEFRSRTFVGKRNARGAYDNVHPVIPPDQ
jgi:hypothetical protein